MTLTLSSAALSDVDRIATIHMAAFGPNAMLQAQFPTAAIRAQLKICIAEKAAADIQDAQTAVLVVRDDRNEIISFAKWQLPVPESDTTYVEPPWRWPTGTNTALLDAWTARVEAAKVKILGDTPCYRLTFLGTDPSHERRGAASLLLRWALDRCAQDGHPAYLESTVEAQALYLRYGFVVGEIVGTRLGGGEGGMGGEGEGKGGEGEVYEEICFLFRPGGR